MALLNCLAAFLHDSHAHLHQQRHNYNQRRNDETVNHGADASLLHAGEGGIQSDGSQCADHQELAGSLGAAHQLRRDRKDARHDGHGQKTQNEPGEDLLDGELSFKRTAVLLESHGFLTLQVLLKPVTEDTLFPLLEELQAMRGQEKPHLLLSLGGETQKLFLSDLLFVESDNHYLTLHTAAGTETFKKNLSEFREELSAAWQASGGTGECFAAAHRSYLVNLAHVERITRTECLLSDGTKIPVSRGCYASLNQAFLQFYRPNAF